MQHEKSAGAVIFRMEKEPIYLLLKHKKNQGNHWAFPKGHTEAGETDEQTAKREIAEETGIQDIQLLPDFREKVSYIFTQEKKTITKEVIFFLAETKTTKIKISEEHAEYIWLQYAETHKKLDYKDSKEILTKAQNYIIKKRITNRNEKS